MPGRIRLITAGFGALLAVTGVVSLTSEAGADDVVCIKKSGAARGFRVRTNGCRPNETELGSFGALQTLLAALSVPKQNTLQLSGVNLRIVDGSGTTGGPTNGRGNLIVGYDEPFDDEAEGERTGSHNVIIGDEHAYTSYGGLAAGKNHRLRAPYASVAGGYGNIALGRFAAVSGGYDNIATGEAATVSGGFENVAGGDKSAVSGGRHNEASGGWSSVGGGLGRAAPALESWSAGSLFESN